MATHGLRRLRQQDRDAGEGERNPSDRQHRVERQVQAGDAEESANGDERRQQRKHVGWQDKASQAGPLVRNPNALIPTGGKVADQVAPEVAGVVDASVVVALVDRRLP